MSVHASVIAVSLAAAATFAVSTTLKHSSAGQVAPAADLHPHRLGRFVRSTLAHPLWLGGIVADAGGLALQVLALHLGALSLVQPLLITSLVFALGLRQLSQRRFDPHTLTWSSLLVLALAAFLVLSGTARSPGAAGVADRTPTVVAGVAGACLVALCLVLARQQWRVARPAVLLGLAVGTTYAATAALLKAVTDEATRGPVALLTGWQLYTVLVAGALGLLLNQLAFQAGPLTASLPAVATVDPLLSIVLGVVVYDEPIRHTPLALAALSAVLVLMGLAVIRLSRLEAVNETGDAARGCTHGGTAGESSTERATSSRMERTGP